MKDGSHPLSFGGKNGQGQHGPLFSEILPMF